MKKKILSFVFFVLIAATVLSVLAFAGDNKRLVTNNGEFYFDFELKSDGIQVSGVIEREDIQCIIIRVYNPENKSAEQNYYFPVSPEAKTTAVIKYPTVETGVTNIELYLSTDLKEGISVFTKSDISIQKLGDTWLFVTPDVVYKHNESWRAGWISMKDAIAKDIPSPVTMLTSNILQGIDTDYEKARAINEWVANNIYYDKDYVLKNKTYTAITPTEVLTDRVSVCEGYANLTVAMLNSASIPAVVVNGYALGVDSSATWSEVKDYYSANHAWVEAYVDGRWIIMDPTWDSKNISHLGKKTTKTPVAYRYFDATLEMFSADHKIYGRPNTFDVSAVSEWAKAEVFPAYDLGLITKDAKTLIKNNITRKEFCDLVVNLVTVKLGMTTDDILKKRQLEINYEFFKDTSDYNILVANALGIVYGKENNLFDPMGLITREEAAVMLMRTAGVLGTTKPNSEKLEFADEAEFANWSRDAIAFVSASLNSEGRRVMGGVEGNKFNPKGYYTKEQSVLTIYRLFKTY